MSSYARTDINNLETLTQHNAVFTAIHLRYGGGGGSDLPKFRFFGRISHRFARNFTTTDEKIQN